MLNINKEDINMPRGRRKTLTNPSEEIQMIDQKIAELQEQIAA